MMKTTRKQLSLSSVFRHYKLEVYQVGYWIGYFILTLIKNTQLDVPYPWWGVLLIDLLIIGIIYTIVAIFAKTYVRPVRGGLILAFTFILYSLLFYGLMYGYLPEKGYILYDEDAVFTWPLFFFSMFLYFHHALIEAGLLAAVYRVRNEERRKRRLLEDKHRLQIQFLMAQIQPHEQYNMLNIAYARTVNRDNELTDILLELKSYMQFVTKHAGDFAEEISLAGEIRHVGQILALYRRRFGGVYVDIDTPGDVSGWYTLPLAASALFKNAFKYGIFWVAETPISFRVECIGRLQRITCRNAINPHKPDEESAGVGNGNIRKRLELVYGPQAHLETTVRDGWYEAVLTIDRDG